MEKNQVTIDDKVTSLEPKVMQVLAFLIKNAGIVVSQEQIFKAVWANQVYSQSLIQRAITLLRKSLGDDAKLQATIVTYPKQGYMLPKTMLTSNQQNPKQNNLLYLVALLSLIALFILFRVIYINDNTKQSFQFINQITASDNIESSPIISPSGDQIAFIQSQLSNLKQILIKSLLTKQEYAVPEMDEYFNLSWSVDEKNIIAWTKRETGFALLKVMLNKNNENIKNQEPTILNINNYDYVSSAMASRDGNIYFVAGTKRLNESYLIQLNEDSNSVTKLMIKPWQVRFVDAKTSPDNQSLALLSLSDDKSYLIDNFEIKTAKITNIIELMEHNVEIAWHPDNEHLLLNNFHGLSLINQQGKEQLLNTPKHLHLRNVNYSADAKTIVALSNQTDIDIVEFIDGLVHSKSESTALDIAARYSNNADKVAYYSNRAGYLQLFVESSGQTSLIFSNPKHREIFGPPVWLGNGNEIAISIGSEILILNIDNQQITKINTSVADLFVYDWFHLSNALLVGAKLNGKLQLSKFNLESGQISALVLGDFGYVQLTDDESVIFIDNGYLYKYSPSGQRHKIELPATGNIVCFVAVENGVVIEIKNEEVGTLWKYDFTTNESTMLMKLPNSLARLQDISKVSNRMLFSTAATHSSDIIILNQ